MISNDPPPSPPPFPYGNLPKKTHQTIEIHLDLMRKEFNKGFWIGGLTALISMALTAGLILWMTACP